MKVMSVQISTTVAPGAALVTLRVGVTPVHLTASEVEILIARLRECRSAMLPRLAPEAGLWDVAPPATPDLALQQ
jgi:hypothetical protein